MPSIRPYRPGDEGGINAVIKSVFDEKEWLWDPRSENRDTYSIEEFYHRRGGGFWVLEDEGQIIGTVGIREKEGPRCTLCRLYLPKEQRGKGHGKTLYRFAMDRAIERGYTEMEIWSDKLLDVSHIMYKNSGAASLGDRRVDDPEYGFPYEEWGYLMDLEKYKSIGV